MRVDHLPDQSKNHQEDSGETVSTIIERLQTKRVIAARLAVILIILLIVGLCWSKELTDLANSQVDAGLKRSLASFALARGFNAVLSIVQGSTVSVQPFGIGMTLALGQILEPINHLVEEFSTVMLFASVAFGIERLLLAVGSAEAISATVTALAVVWCSLYAFGRAPAWISRLLTLLLFVRFVMPVVIIGSGYVFDKFSAADYRESSSVLEQVISQVNSMSREALKIQTEPKVPAAPLQNVQPLVPVQTPPPLGAGPSADPKGLLARVAAGAKDSMNTVATSVSAVKDKISNAVDYSTDAIKSKYEALKLSAEKAAEKLIVLTVIFVAQTVVVPLLLLLMTYRLFLGLIPTATQQFIETNARLKFGTLASTESFARASK